MSQQSERERVGGRGAREKHLVLEVEGRGGQALSRSDCLRVDQCFHPVLSAALHQDQRKGPTVASICGVSGTISLSLKASETHSWSVMKPTQDDLCLLLHKKTIWETLARTISMNQTNYSYESDKLFL